MIFPEKNYSPVGKEFNYKDAVNNLAFLANFKDTRINGRKFVLFQTYCIARFSYGH